MELQEFIRRTIVEIVSAVVEAQKEIAATGAVINPSGVAFRPDQHQGSSWTGDGNLVRLIQFDVAITASEGTGTKGGIGIMMGAIALGSQGQSKQATEAVSRLRFEVPLLLPATELVKR
jgi:hypothetical protein